MSHLATASGGRPPRHRSPRHRRTALGGSLLAAATLIGVGLTGAPTATATTQTYTVDLGTTTGAVLNGAGGALYGQSDAGVPSDNLLAPLKLATGSQKPPNGLQHPNGDILQVAPSFFADGGGTMYTNIQDEYATWPYPTTTLANYLPTVDSVVNTLKTTSYASKVVFVPFNEPDDQWFSGLGGGSGYATALSSFESWWSTVYQRIRSDYPAAKIAGPNTAGFDTQFFGDFLSYAKANNVLPDVFTWHELGPGSLATFRGHYSTYRGLESTRGIASIPINIDEYANRRDLSVPGQIIQWAAMFEDEKVYADQAFWDAAGNMSGDTVHTNIPNGTWWLYRWLAGMTGQTAKATPPQANVQDTLQGVASLDTTRKQAQVVIGGSATDTNVVFNNIPGATFGSSVEVTVQKDAWSGYEGASAAPLTVSRATYTPSGGSISVPLTGLDAMSAYRITVTPDGGGSATAPSVPWSASYEAENAAITSGMVTTEASSSAPQLYAASGGKDVTGLSASSSAVSFAVSVPSAGTYNMQVFYGNGSGTPAQQALRIDGANPQWVTYQDTLNPEYHSVVTVPVTLSAGSHTVSLAKSDGSLGTGNGSATLDKITLTAAPTGPGTPETVYEAAFADTTGNATYDYSTIGETGTGAVVLTSGGRTVFDAYAPSDGYYTVKTDYSSAGGSAALALNGTTVATLGSTSGSFSTASSRIYLQAGINLLAITPASGTTISLRDLKLDGSGDTTGVATYQAENATLAGKAVIQTNAWASGGKDAGYIGNGSGNTLSFGNVTAAAAGRYTVVVHYAENDRSGSGNYNTNLESRTAQLSVNGGSAGTITFRNTYGWSDWWSVATTVSLNAGSNTLTFGNPSAYAPDIDYIEVAAVNG